jgi:site-specific recombinase XerD
VAEASGFLEGEMPVASKVEAFIAQAMAASADRDSAAHALVPWMCDVLQSNHSFKAYDRDLVDFVRRMAAKRVDPLQVTADHVKLYKRALLEAGLSKGTVARRLSVIRGTYEQLAAKGLVAWEVA